MYFVPCLRCWSSDTLSFNQLKAICPLKTMMIFFIAICLHCVVAPEKCEPIHTCSEPLISCPWKYPFFTWFTSCGTWFTHCGTWFTHFHAEEQLPLMPFYGRMQLAVGSLIETFGSFRKGTCNKVLIIKSGCLTYGCIFETAMASR